MSNPKRRNRPQVPFNGGESPYIDGGDEHYLPRDHSDTSEEEEADGASTTSQEDSSLPGREANLTPGGSPISRDDSHISTAPEADRDMKDIKREMNMERKMKGIYSRYASILALVSPGQLKERPGYRSVHSIVYPLMLAFGFPFLYRKNLKKGSAPNAIIGAHAFAGALVFLWAVAVVAISELIAQYFGKGFLPMDYLPHNPHDLLMTLAVSPLILAYLFVLPAVLRSIYKDFGSHNSNPNNEVFLKVFAVFALGIGLAAASELIGCHFFNVDFLSEAGLRTDMKGFHEGMIALATFALGMPFLYQTEKKIVSGLSSGSCGLFGRGERLTGSSTSTSALRSGVGSLGGGDGAPELSSTSTVPEAH